MSENFRKSKVILVSVLLAILIFSTIIGVLIFSDIFFTKEKILFVSDSSNSSDIFSMDTDGTNVINITNKPSYYKKPVCSPNGKQISFLSDRDGSWQVYIMNIDGTGLEKVKGATSLDTPYSWSPDGRYLLVESLRDINSQIYAIDIKKGIAQNLSNNVYEDGEPSWSADGKKIVFISDRENKTMQAYILNVESGQVTKMPNDKSRSVISPMFSPDGQKLVYYSDTEENTNIVVCDAEGKEIKIIDVDEPGWAVPQAWSSDGKKLIVDVISGSGKDTKHAPIMVDINNDKLTKKIQNNYSLKASLYVWTKKMKGFEVKLHQQEVQSSVDLAKVKRDILIKNAVVINGTGNEPVTGVNILIKNGKIEALGNNLEEAKKDSTIEIDLKGAYVLPGFINAHVHHAYNSENLKKWAQEGVTTVRDLGAYIGWDIFGFRDKVSQNPYYATINSAGPMFTAPGGYPYGSYSLEVNSVSEAQLKCDDVIDRGADIVKIAIESGGFLGSYSPVLNEDLTKCLVDVAHKRKTIAVAHTDMLNSEYLEQALDAGVDDIAHLMPVNMSDEIITKMVAKGVYVEPTLEVLDSYKYIAIENLRKYVMEGGKVALGTDYGGSPFGLEMELGMPMIELHGMLEAGMTSMQIIVASTKNAAYVCNRQNDIGTVEVGKEADLLILNSNPLEDIDNLRDIKMVINDGVIIRD